MTTEAPKEVQPGCSEPDQVPPSVVGTSHDPKRVKQDDVTPTPKTEEEY